MLIDEVVIEVGAGNGGNGVISFKRNAQTAKGGPDGGNGGNGGNLYFYGKDDITLLTQFSYKKNIAAENGVNGSKKNMYGRNGKDLVVYLPLGTLVTDLKSNYTFEITNTNDKLLICKGGKGGRGNNEFKSATTQAPKYRELGEKGQTKSLQLELKLIADIGIIGLPNAGKSSLLSILTNAHPKIGDYPFTTLEPNLGVFKNIVLADIPGLIEGASKGKGLGDKFLRHIEKTKLLVHCIEATNIDIVTSYKTIRQELKEYNPILLEKKELVLITKSDLVDSKLLLQHLKRLSKFSNNVHLLSIYDTKQIEELKILLTDLTK